MTTAVVWDERYMWYDFGSYAHVFNQQSVIQPGTLVENPESKRRIMNLLAASGLLDQLVQLKPTTVSREMLCLFHDEEFVERIEKLSADQGGFAGEGLPLPKGGADIAKLAVGGTLAAIRAVMQGDVDNAYAIVRPPGHHAEKNVAMGLCLFANIAVSVMQAMKEFQVGRVAILDWDAHHGNGTESAFYRDPNVLTLSIHQDGVIHGRGKLDDSGEGPGEGYNINIPLPPGSGEGAYLAAFERVVIPAITEFKPELIVVASGLDAAITDPTARMLLTPACFRSMTRIIKELADNVCNGRLVLSHEGGYDETISPFCALAIFEELSNCVSNVSNLGNPFENSGFGLIGGDHQQLQPHQNTIIDAAEAQIKNTFAN